VKRRNREPLPSGERRRARDFVANQSALRRGEITALPARLLLALRLGLRGRMRPRHLLDATTGRFLRTGWWVHLAW
jgi:hypothetical protein